ncbi:MAG: dipeptide ABC transporter ATP-binding protein [Anaerolineae bacterium]
MTAPILETHSLSIDYLINKQWLNAIRDVTLQIQPLQIHGLVGESGSGKTTLGLAMMRYLDANARISTGEILFDGEDIAHLSPETMRAYWGSRMNLVPQNPLDSLNPSMTIGEQMAELTRQHLGHSRNEALAHAVRMLTQVRIADPQTIIRRYPHQLSGGMQQRVMIAMALSTRPRLLVLDEPTTALDVTTQAVILDLFRELIRNEQAAALYVSHDLGTVAQLCDHVTVLYAGEIMESASVHDLYHQPLHPYTTGLMASLPGAASGPESRLATIEGVAPSLIERAAACVFADRCPVAIDHCHTEKPPLEHMPDGRDVRCWRWEDIAAGTVTPRNQPQGKVAPAPPEAGYVLEAQSVNKQFGVRGLLSQLIGKPPERVQAVNQVSLRINARSTLGLVGESGSGKTTLARCIVGLETADAGDMTLLEMPLPRQLSRRIRDSLRNLQMVFQNPHDALNPYHTVGAALERTLQVLTPPEDVLSRADRQHKVRALLEAVGLTAEYATRYPAQLSGGEKQRVAIARAFAANPALVVADEPTSSLDVSVQAVILNLLKDLRAEHGASYLIISHDLEVISYLADWIMVMYLGEIVEEGSNEQVYAAPSHPYTEALLSAVPLPRPGVTRGRIRLEGEVPSPRNRPSGCPFHTRCPRKIGLICEQESPPVRDAGDGHLIRCHITVEELTAMQSAARAEGV